MQQDDLGGRAAQQAGLRFTVRPRINVRETKRGVVLVKRVVAGARRFFAVRHQPVFALAVVAGQFVKAALERGSFRLPFARQLDDVTGVPVARRRPFERRDQGGGPDLAGGQAARQLRAGGQELRLPDDPVLAVRQVVPARIGGEVGVVLDVGGEVPRLGVVEADAAAGPLAAPHRVLPPFVGVHPVLAGRGDVAGDARPGGRAQERHALGALRDGEEVRGGQQVVEEDLQAAVEQRRTGDVALLAPRRPQTPVHLHVEQVGARNLVHQDALDGLEIRAVLEGLAEDRFQPFVEVAVVGEERGPEVGPVNVAEPGGRFDPVVVAHQPHLAAAVQFAS